MSFSNPPREELLLIFDKILKYNSLSLMLPSRQSVRHEAAQLTCLAGQVSSVDLQHSTDISLSLALIALSPPTSAESKYQ